jgi:DNA-binding transcriptional ArsR family regulator
LSDVVTATCRALSHRARRTLLRALLRGECDVGTLSAGCGLDQPTASKHLATLRGAGLVQVRVDSRRHCYSLTHAEIVRPLLDLLDALEAQEGGPGPGGPASGD